MTNTTLTHLKQLELGYHTYILDGDNIRHGLNSDLEFDENSRIENIRRIGEVVAKLFVDSGTIVITAFISLFIKDRKKVRTIINNEEFIEVFVDVLIEVCESRDPKGLYKKAREGQIKNFTGIDSTYEKPKDPSLHIINDKSNINENIDKIINYLKNNGYIKC